MKLSIAILAHNEAANLRRTLQSVAWADELILVDSGSTDETVSIAEEFGAKVFHESWKGYGGQMNSAIDKCTSPWVFSLDADEVLTPELQAEIQELLKGTPNRDAYWVPRRNQIFGRWMRHGGQYPDYKLRLFQQGTARLPENTEPHATPKWSGPKGKLRGDLLHYQYPTVALYVEHMNRYSSASVPLVLRKGRTCRGLLEFLSMTLLNPVLTFIKNYIFRGGFLDGREGLLFHLYHSSYISWKYAKAWEVSRDVIEK
ncbi:glycosyltransferase family 2 protein [Acidicapsa ligni]|uniref:glycosyltransferase family 2 protein n=1 Tax=Acidicapsa ligni TaxID=542300 RepID=UPI0021DFD556|nr:glycosyltransferase family 2 protein [Acidicapsa ligni]